jgi:hypothetical protein
VKDHVPALSKFETTGGLAAGFAAMLNVQLSVVLVGCSDGYFSPDN